MKSAQKYLNSIIADCSSAESKNLAINFLSNADLSLQKFSFVMASLAFTSGDNEETCDPIVLLASEQIDRLKTILTAVLHENIGTETTSVAQNCFDTVRVSQRRSTRKHKDIQSSRTLLYQTQLQRSKTQFLDR